MTTIDVLKNLDVALGCATDMESVTGDTIPELIQFIADNYPG